MWTWQSNFQILRHSKDCARLFRIFASKNPHHHTNHIVIETVIQQQRLPLN